MVAEARRTSPGLTPALPAASRSTLTCTCGSSTWSSARRSAMPRMPASAAVTSRLLAQDVALRAVQAHDDRRARAGEHFAHLVAQVGVHAALAARIALDGFPHRSQRLVVVRRGIDADPDLARIDADDLIAGHRAPDVRAD